MVMHDSQSRPGKPCGGMYCSGVSVSPGSAEAVVPDEIRVLVKEGDDLAGEGGRHLLGGGIEQDDDGEVAVVGEEFLELGMALVWR
jgi:hypothetical protein